MRKCDTQHNNKRQNLVALSLSNAECQIFHIQHHNKKIRHPAYPYKRPNAVTLSLVHTEYIRFYIVILGAVMLSVAMSSGEGRELNQRLSVL